MKAEAIQDMSTLQAELLVVAARPMLSAAVTRPRPKTTFSTSLVLRRSCKSQRRNSGMSAVVMSMIHASTTVRFQRPLSPSATQHALTQDLLPFTCCVAVLTSGELQWPPGTFL